MELGSHTCGWWDLTPVADEFSHLVVSGLSHQWLVGLHTLWLVGLHTLWLVGLHTLWLVDFTRCGWWTSHVVAGGISHLVARGTIDESHERNCFLKKKNLREVLVMEITKTQKL